ncbi:curli assembly protein CsgF [Stutzerimonas tarimensis]|uniref:Curli production assembly/transport component CsgF n=1 Tax=Stutzerimonas tarimensis TaxID=1507735 RepID=A0ABV7T2U6_9GAMM
MTRSMPLMLAGLCLAGTLHASELVYQPVNPSFGGNPLNGGWLLGNAQAQNDHENPNARSLLRNQSALERFTSQLESRLLSQLLSNISDGNAGSLTTDAFVINILDSDGFLTVDITDRLTGERSQIVIDGLGQGF